MEVAISELRARLGDWVDRAREGEQIIVTDRGLPVARLVGLDATDPLERLTEAGVISKPRHATRPRAGGRRKVAARGSVADLVNADRR
jgi:prevent-host-death family protein